jgi:hypothetical protein
VSSIQLLDEPGVPEKNELQRLNSELNFNYLKRIEENYGKEI